MVTLYLRRLVRAFLPLIVLLAAAISVNAQAFTENFDDITLLTGNGWVMQNLSSPVGTTNWFQGNNVAAGGPFDSYNGAANAYIGANFNNTGSTGTISNWLMTPNRTLRNGDVFTFYTRKVSPDSYADRLEVRLSTNGASTNAGITATSVGDFTTLLVSINPTLVLGVYPVVWTQYTITISGLPAPTSGRIAFRYFVTSAGFSGTNSDYIGIDNVVYTPYVCPVLTVSPGTVPNATAGVAYSQALSQTGALGTPSYAVTAGTLPPGLTLSAGGVISGTPTATGTYNFTVTVSDASGCSVNQSYSLVVVCPTITLSPGSLPNGTAGAAYNQSLSQTGGIGIVTYSFSFGALPPGMTMSSGGVISGTPTATGTYSVGVTATDGNACTGNNTYVITIDCPVGGASLSGFSPVCSNGGAITLTGGTPAGGTYSGTNVSGGMFDPSAGAQTITYTVIDPYSCTQTATASFPVNTAPTVTLDTFPPLCTNSAAFTLYGGLPAGGTYSGAGVAAGIFTPGAAGPVPVTYTYTDANTCTNTATSNITVNTAAGTTLAGTAGNTETRSFMVVGPTEARYTDCDLMADADPSGAQPLNGTTTFGVTIDNTVNTYIGQPYLQRHFDIVPVNNAANATANITLYAYQSEFDAFNVQATALGFPLLPTGGVDNGNVKISQFHGTGTAPGNYTGVEELIIPVVNWDAVNGWWVMDFPVSGFSGFYIHTAWQAHALAIKVSDISAVNEGSYNIVKWETKTEQPGDMFVLEHSADGRSFTSLVTVPAKGAASDYTYRDEAPVKGINYYRLKLVSSGDDQGYTNVVSATVKNSGAVLVQAYPNPVSDKVTVKAFGQQGNPNVSITDVTGRQLIKTTMPDNGVATIDVSALSPGIYYVVYSDAVNTQTIKINKQ